MKASEAKLKTDEIIKMKRAWLNTADILNEIKSTAQEGEYNLTIYKHGHTPEIINELIELGYSIEKDDDGDVEVSWGTKWL